MHLSIAYDFLPKQRTVNTNVLMDHFGVGFDQGRHVVAEGVDLKVSPGDVVLFVGPSGSGKSSLLRESVRRIDGERGGERDRESGRRGDGASDLVHPIPLSPAPPVSHSPTLPVPSTVWIDRLTLPDKPLVDALGLPFKEALGLLSACGLSEAQIMLRTPSELSDGQRYRFRIALAAARLQNHPSQIANRKSAWLVADEFTACLDRTLARVLSYNLRRLSSRTGVGLLLATTHEDIIDDLQPDTLIRCNLDGFVSIDNRKSKIENPPISFFAGSGSARAPDPIGRTSLGGIIEATGWGWFGA